MSVDTVPPLLFAISFPLRARLGSGDGNILCGRVVGAYAAVAADAGPASRSYETSFVHAAALLLAVVRHPHWWRLHVGLLLWRVGIAIIVEQRRRV